MLFALVLAMQAVASIARYGNPVIAAIGALSDQAPLPAMLVAYHFAVKGSPCHELCNRAC